MMVWSRIGAATSVVALAWGGASVAQDAAGPSELNRAQWTLRAPAGKTLAWTELTTPYIAVHWAGSTPWKEISELVPSYARTAASDAGVTHLFLAPSAESLSIPQLPSQDDAHALVRVVHEPFGEAARALKLDSEAPAITVLLDRTGRELARNDLRAYSEFRTMLRGATRAPALSHYNLPRGSTLAMQGYDAVSSIDDDRARKGDARHESMFQGVTYRFANEEHRLRFAANPTRYLPTYGGWCASAMGDKGTKVEIDPTNFKVKGGRLFLFYKGVFSDAKSDWNKREKEWEPAADRNWKSLTGEEPASSHDK
jgi:YHS domain-containing protein